MSVILHKGDLFGSNDNVYCHGVNCVGAMGKGIALEFKARYPQMYEKYKKRCKEGRIIPGSVYHYYDLADAPQISKDGTLLAVPVPDTHIFNLAIKSHWRLPATYNALEASLNNMVSLMQENSLTSVSMPWIGCNLGGLEKKYVKFFMEKSVKNTNVTFNVYEM